jgi:uncharacterized protein
MTNPIIGRGWHFPPELDERGTIRLTDEESEIRQAMRLILSTAPGQRVMRPEFGCRIHELIFAPNNAATAGLASRYVQEALGRWEPRINVRRVDILPSNNSYLNITIQYQITATHSNRSLVYPFYLLPDEAERLPDELAHA